MSQRPGRLPGHREGIVKGNGRPLQGRPFAVFISGNFKHPEYPNDGFETPDAEDAENAERTGEYYF
jgi:hypothetical protein